MFKKGFTLIELLVVIAIIAILAAILFPVFAQAREKARQSSCLSNVKQLSTAFFLYADDYDECFPAYSAVLDHGTNWYQWVTSPSYGFSWWTPFVALYPYFKNSGLLICPSQAKNPSAGSPSFRAATWNYDGVSTTYQSSYGMNTSLASANGDPWAPTPVTLSQLTTTGNFILLTEGSVPMAGPGDSPNQVDVRHNGGSNIGFADGHAKFYKYGAGPTEQWSNIGAGWPKDGQNIWWNPDAN